MKYDVLLFASAVRKTTIGKMQEHAWHLCHSPSCAIDWLYQWQTLLAGVGAIAAAAISVYFLRQQIALSERQFRAEVSARIKAEQDAKRQATPDFAVTPAGIEELDDRTVFRFRVTNVGPPVANVALAYRNHWKREGMLDKGHSIDFEFVCRSDAVPAFESATLSYRKLDGGFASHSFGFTRKEEKGHMILTC